jgi:hypothetical protein
MSLTQLYVVDNDGKRPTMLPVRVRQRQGNYTYLAAIPDARVHASIQVHLILLSYYCKRLPVASTTQCLKLCVPSILLGRQ